ncbi:pilus assembly protein TadG-related protein [Humibacter sp.]|uniref:pilus assembly protein TadG-related protein n=1 Tax=Humibacter sp. TaxID=1940291 RepID=UPI003F7F59E0
MNGTRSETRFPRHLRSGTIARGLADDTGSILPLVIFYTFLCLVLVLLVSAVTSLYLERERLYAVADGAALAGAESYDLESVAVIDGHPRPTLESPAVRAAVAEFLSTAVADGFDALEVEQAGSADGRSAVVRLSAVWHPPVVSVLVPAGIRIGVTSTARSVFW